MINKNVLKTRTTKNEYNLKLVLAISLKVLKTSQNKKLVSRYKLYFVLFFKNILIYKLWTCLKTFKNLNCQNFNCLAPVLVECVQLLKREG